jgi:hypothetical protein
VRKTRRSVRSEALSLIRSYIASNGASTHVPDPA